MNEPITKNQLVLLKKLLNGKYEEKEKEILELTKTEAFSYIEDLIEAKKLKQEQVADKSATFKPNLEKDFRTERYSISFMSMLKSLMDYKAQRNEPMTLKEAIEQVKEVY